MADKIAWLRALLGRTTAGRWEIFFVNGNEPEVRQAKPAKDWLVAKGFGNIEDAVFMVSAKNALPLLLDIAEAAEPALALVEQFQKTHGEFPSVVKPLSAALKLFQCQQGEECPKR